MTFIDWFSGIGGFRRGLELAGNTCIGFCEIDKYAVASYTSMHLLTEAQREYLAELPIKKRQKEILKEEYRNGEWYASDITRVCADDIPRADCWCLGFPCQDISIAGKQAGFQGNRSSLFFRIMYLIGQLREEDKPAYLFIENVKNLLSVNGAWDFARLLIEMDRGGYDAEWQVLNSKDFGVPQNRERIFIVGHLRGKSRRQVFPIERPDSENHVQQIGMQKSGRNNPNQGRVYSPKGISPTLNTMGGGGREPHIALPAFCDMNIGAGLKTTDAARTLQAKYNVLTPDRAVNRQNGRRFKENGDPMFTLTAQDRHGIAIKVREATKQGYAEAIVRLENGNEVYAIWSEEHGCYLAIRKLTPRECFRLQGWEDEYFERAEMVNSDSQLYKQAGNGVAVPVIKAIGEQISAVCKQR